MKAKAASAGRFAYWPRLLFAIPMAMALWVPGYNRLEPALGGVPFFYWYQLAWILLGAAIVLIVYALETKFTRVAHTPEAPLDSAGTPGDIL